jgi:hypothetical protein
METLEREREEGTWRDVSEDARNMLKTLMGYKMRRY